MIQNKKSVLINLKKTRSLIEKIMKMVEEDKYCIDIMQQVLASIGLLKSVNQKLLENHLNSCFSEGIISKNKKKKEKLIKEILRVVELKNR